MKCLFCDKELVLKDWERKQGLKKTKRKYCDRICNGRKKIVNPITTCYRRLKVNGKRISEHRYVMEIYLGRKIERWELVHHIDGNKLNNDISNLKIVNFLEHGEEHRVLPKEKNCTVCGKIFVPHKTKRRRQKTCSKECRYNSYRKIPSSTSKKSI